MFVNALESTKVKEIWKFSNIVLLFTKCDSVFMSTALTKGSIFCTPIALS